MANKRMFNIKIVDSDAFLDMPLSAQALYFHLNMRADDDGFIGNPKRVKNLIGASDDDLRLLIMKRFVLIFETGVIVIKHWRMHNTLSANRYKETTFIDEKETLLLKKNNAYSMNDGNRINDEKYIAMASRQTKDEQKTNTDIGLDLDIGLDIDINNNTCANSVQNAPTIAPFEPENAPKEKVQFDNKGAFEKFWSEYPRKVNKKKAHEKFIKICKNEDIFDAIMNGLDRCKKSKQWQIVEYIPHAITWLNGERWNDEIEAMEDASNQSISKRRKQDEPLPDWYYDQGEETSEVVSDEEIKELLSELGGRHENRIV